MKHPPVRRDEKIADIDQAHLSLRGELTELYVVLCRCLKQRTAQKSSTRTVAIDICWVCKVKNFTEHVIFFIDDNNCMSGPLNPT